MWDYIIDSSTSIILVVRHKAIQARKEGFNSKILFQVPYQQIKLPPWRKILFKELIGPQLGMNFFVLCGTPGHITIFTRTHCWIMSRTRYNQSTPQHPIYLSLILILFSHPHTGIPRSSFPFRFSA
jgi:hypothetical protein